MNTNYCFILKSYHFIRFPLKVNNIFLLKSGLATNMVRSEYHYPLDSLSAEEIQETTQIVHATIPALQNTGNWVFNTIVLKEPEKHLMLPYFLSGSSPPPYAIPRKAFVILMEKIRNVVTELVVNLSERKVESWKLLPIGTQPAFSSEEHHHCSDIAIADPQVQERIHQMGFFNMSLIRGSCWNVGYGDDRPLLKSAIRPVLVFLYGKLFDKDNQYGKF